ncbi:MAG: hypothetical protein AAB587_01920 [Patescibacteria group bacterium]
MKSHDRNSLEALLVTLIFVFHFLIIFSGLFINKDVVFRTLRSQGYSNIEITDRSWFLVRLRGCGAYDYVRFTAKATNPRGDPAEVYVCAGLLKGGTIQVK